MGVVNARIDSCRPFDPSMSRAMFGTFANIALYTGSTRLTKSLGEILILVGEDPVVCWSCPWRRTRRNNEPMNALREALTLFENQTALAFEPLHGQDIIRILRARRAVAVRFDMPYFLHFALRCGKLRQTCERVPSVLPI